MTEKGLEVRYANISEGSKLSVGIFFLPKGSSIPLHDHPNMTVFSKILFGSIKFRSYDWQPSSCQSVFSAHLVDENLFSEQSGVLEVRPDRCNIHSMEAMEHSAFLDVILPPYNDERPCSYYKELPCSYSSCIHVEKRPRFGQVVPRISGCDPSSDEGSSPAAASDSENDEHHQLRRSLRRSQGDPLCDLECSSEALSSCSVDAVPRCKDGVSPSDHGEHRHLESIADDFCIEIFPYTGPPCTLT